MRNDSFYLLFSDTKGRICSHPKMQAAGMEGDSFCSFKRDDLIKLPVGSRLFFLTDRAPVFYDPDRHDFSCMDERSSGGRYYPVAAFTPPGFTVTHTCAYKEVQNQRVLPLFSYAACALHRGEFYAAAVRVDRNKRHDFYSIDINEVKKNIKIFRKIFAANRLVRHLEKCALEYRCPNAQNFFLSRYEAPLPASPHCNAACIGCISYQAGASCVSSQERISFVPTPEEIRDIAVFHIHRVREPIVSFGQGCEGEPLLSGDVIECSIKLIRKETKKGTININTNASRPYVLRRLLDAGLDSLRVSLNSVRPDYYRKYYRPSRYSFRDVLKSIEEAKRAGVFVSLNYLTMPGFTDSAGEFEALKVFLRKYKVDMLQWRNLNIDPLRYFRLLGGLGNREAIGMKRIMSILKAEFPKLKTGYFNPHISAVR